MRRIFSAAALAAFALAVSIPATAAEVRPSVGLGGMWYTGTPRTDAFPGLTHYGVYPCLGGSLAVITDRATIAPGLCVEWAPEFDAWGAFPSLMVDLPVGEHWGIDVIASAWSDQVGGDFNNVAFYGGGGAGASYFVDDQWTVSASFNAYAGLNAPAAGFVVAPGLALSYTFGD